ncbi:GNAT family N-acetyltransferase [Kitasatospora sp. NPDC028055]|uniref:GNAT family N-acetyltransferase n=1 Tax=Kitasatospora sp. NPDC028055 TaxID=3155653 RepID=UPI0033F64883
MIEVRPAAPADAPELVRLRNVMLQEMPGMAASAGPAHWQAAAERMLRERLAAPAEELTMSAFVVDDPERPGRLAACAVGTLEHRLPSPGNPDGLFGSVFNICTDPDRRLRGYARACTEALLDWFDGRRVGRVDLHASSGGEALYRSLGFAEYSTALSRKRPY